MDNEKKTLISFVTQDHIYHARSNDFYWTVGILAVVVAVLSFIFNNALFGVLVLIGAFMYGYVSSKKPNDLPVLITNMDITIGNDVYDVSKIKSFNVLEIGEEKDLVLSVDRAYQPMVSVCLPDEIAQDVKNSMLSLMKEDKALVPHIGRRFIAKYKL